MHFSYIPIKFCAIDLQTQNLFLSVSCQQKRLANGSLPLTPCLGETGSEERRDFLGPKVCSQPTVVFPPAFL